MEHRENQVPIERPRCGKHIMRHVLICLDRSVTSEASLPLATTLARRFDSDLHLVHVLESGSVAETPPDAMSWQIVREEAGAYLADVAARLTADRLRVGATVLKGHVAEQVLCLADREEVDLIVLSSHGEKGITEWDLASTTEKILARTRTSVLVVPADDRLQSPQPEPPFERILLLLDGSPHAESVLPPFEWLAREQGAELVLLSVVSPPELFECGPPSATDLDLQRRLATRNEQAAQRYLAQIRTRLNREGCNTHEIVERGDLRSLLPVVTARENIDLIAITAHGRTGDRACCYGGTAGHLIRHAPAPILMIQNLPEERGEFAQAVRHRRQAAPLRGRHGVRTP